MEASVKDGKNRRVKTEFSSGACLVSRGSNRELASVTGQMKIGPIHMSGNATYQDLSDFFVVSESEVPCAAIGV
jgi:hypothetical protein